MKTLTDTNNNNNNTYPEEVKISGTCHSEKKVIKWEEYVSELARLCSLSSAVDDCKERKLGLVSKLQLVIQSNTESLRRLNELEEMRQKLEGCRLVLGNLSMQSKIAAGYVRKKEEQLSIAIQSLLLAGKAHSMAYKHLQEVNKMLAGERSHVHLSSLQKTLRMRLQYLVGQVSALYPVKVLAGPASMEKFQIFSFTDKSGSTARSKKCKFGILHHFRHATN